MKFANSHTDDLRDALEEVARCTGHRPYIWRPRTMEKLASIGLVETEELMCQGKVSYRITELGRAALLRTAGQ